jgi:cytoskeletal protein CcmA (bactofilin family)
MGFFSRENRSSPSEVIENVIGSTANVQGSIQSEGGVRIDGVFEGSIHVAGNVIIGEGARVVANITARNITVGGAVKGDIDGSGRLEILSTGQVYGDICVGSVMIDEGGMFQGISRMRGHEQRALPGPSQANPAPAGSPPAAQTGSAQARTAPARTAQGDTRGGPQAGDDNVIDVHIEPLRESKPAPSHPAPSHPAPSQPTPSQPTPSQPAPSQPAAMPDVIDDFDFSELAIEPFSPESV